MNNMLHVPDKETPREIDFSSSLSKENIYL